MDSVTSTKYPENGKRMLNIALWSDFNFLGYSFYPHALRLPSLRNYVKYRELNKTDIRHTVQKICFQVLPCMVVDDEEGESSL